MTNREANIANAILEVIDYSDGIPVVKIEEVMMQSVSFSLFVRLLNILFSHGLIWIDQDHIARRVK